MGGIAGLIDLGALGTAASGDSTPWLPAVLARMTDGLAPRGPDAAGLWTAPGIALGHRRLKILDLSDAAAQPMGTPEGRLQVVFDGEIYNFADLRAELRGRGHVFRTRSDTEVLLHGYDAWGEGLLERLQGMFAFALWDASRRRLFGARDRLGKKPFYFAEVDRPGESPLFAFASELKALRVVPGISRAIDPRALAAYLSFDFVPPPATIFAQVRKLDAGEQVMLDLGSGARGGRAVPVRRRYWQLPSAAQGAISRWRAGDAAVELRTLLTRAVERRLSGEVPLGLLLSGGLAAWSVAATTTRLLGADRLPSFSLGVGAPSFEDSAQDRLIARHLGTEHHEVRLDSRTLLEVLPSVSELLDEPLADPSIVPTCLLAGFARQHITVALGGHGGQLLLAGGRSFASDLPGRPLLDRLPAFLQAPLGGVLAALSTISVEPLTDFQVRFYLANDLNVQVDRAAGAVGLELRAPLQDQDLLTFIGQLPARLRRPLTGPGLLARALRGLLPDPILDRPPPGTPLPVARWLREELRPALLDELHPDRLQRQALFDPRAVTTLLDDHLLGRANRHKALWALFTFQRWHARWSGG